MRVLALAILVAVFAGGAASAEADVFDDNLAGASRGAGDMVVVGRGADGAIYERHLSGGTWSPWAWLGGAASSGPAAAAYGDSIHVFVTGTDGGVYENVLRAGAWSGWSALGGGSTSAPAAVARRATDLLDLVVRGTDNALHHRYFQPGAGWSGWEALGGNATGGPAVNSQEANVLNVWHRATDGQLVQRAWKASWSDWMPLGGQIIGAPSVISRMEGHVDVFARGTDRATYQKYWHQGVGWSDWLQLDAAPLDSTPAAASDRPGHVVLFARRGPGVVVKEWTDTAGWTGWVDWGRVAPPPPPAPPPAPRDGSVRIRTGIRCTPPGGRLKVSLKIRKRAGAPAPRVRRVVFFVKHGPRRTDHRRPWVKRLRLNRPAGSRGRVYARAVYTRKGSPRLHRKTVSKRYVMCG